MNLFLEYRFVQPERETSRSVCCCSLRKSTADHAAWMPLIRWMTAWSNGLMAKIAVFQAPDAGGKNSVALVLSQDAVFLASSGEPFPAIGLRPHEAREVAMRLLCMSRQIELKLSQSDSKEAP